MYYIKACYAVPTRGWTWQFIIVKWATLNKFWWNQNLYYVCLIILSLTILNIWNFHWVHLDLVHWSCYFSLICVIKSFATRFKIINIPIFLKTVYPTFSPLSLQLPPLSLLLNPTIPLYLISLACVHSLLPHIDLSTNLESLLHNFSKVSKF